MTSAFEGAFMPPLGDFCVMTAEKNLWHFHAAEFSGLRVLGGFQNARGAKRFVHSAHVIAQHARDESSDGIHDDDGCDGTVGEDVVTDGDLVIHPMLDDAMIHALVVATDEDEMFLFCEFFRESLIKATALRCHQDDSAFQCINGLKRGKKRLGF